MNAITLRNTPEPIVPEALEEAIRAYLRPVAEGRGAVEGFQRAVSRISASQAPRVAALAQGYDMHLAVPINRASLKTWLDPLCDAVGQHPTADAFEGRLTGVLVGAPGLPLACLSERSFAAAVRAFGKWFPSAQELIELLEEQAGILRSRQRALVAVHGLMVPAGTAAPPEKRADPTEAEIAAVGAMVSAFTSERQAANPELAAGGAPETKPRIKPGYLSPLTAATLRCDIAGLPACRPTPRGASRPAGTLERQHPEVRLGHTVKAPGSSGCGKTRPIMLDSCLILT